MMRNVSRTVSGTMPHLTVHKPERSNFRVVLATLAMLLVGFLVTAQAQQITGTIAGTVKDPQGAAITSAIVKATNTDTGFTRSVPTNEYGEYRIEFLPVGTYNFEVNAPNFEEFIQRNLVLTVDQTQTVNVKLNVGAQTQTVTVNEIPPAVDTTDAELGRTIETAEIIGLPLVNRNAYAELSLTPGVEANSMSQQSNPSGTMNFVNGLSSADVQVNGSIDGANPEVSFYLDGGLNMQVIRNYGNLVPNPDALEEFRVETSDFSAQYGRMSSAVVTAVTKSGTNQFHGAMFEFNRNTDFNAYPWNAPKNVAGQFINAPYHRNQFGGVIGGPVKKDRAFFFFSYGGLRQVVGSYESGGRVPTTDERLGDFTADTFKVYMPGTKMQVDGTNTSPNCQVATMNCIPVSLLDPTAATLMSGTNPSARIPLPNTLATGSAIPTLWTGYFTGSIHQDEYLAKYDEVLGGKDHLAVTYFGVPITEDDFGGGNIAPYSTEQTREFQTNINISEVHTFNPETFNQTWISVTRVAAGRVDLPLTSIGQLGSSYTIQGAASLPDISVSGDFTLGDANAGPVTTSDFYSVRDMVSMTKGKHTFYFGGELALEKAIFLAYLDNYGVFSFASTAPTTTGNALSDFVTGMLSSMEQDTPYHSLFSEWHTSVFGQDNYRITSRFTANLGVRWDFDTPPVESSNLTATFVNSEAALTSNGGTGGTESTVVPTAPPGMFFPGDPNVPRGILTMRWHHVSPRVGLAWDPFGDGKTAVRAGVGLFFGLLGGNDWNQSSAANPYCVRQVFDSVRSMSDPYASTMVNGAPSSFPNGDLFPYTYRPTSPRWLVPASVAAIAENVQWPYVYQLNASVERQLPENIMVTVAYVGTLSHDVPFTIDDNYAPYVPGVSGESTSQASIDSRRPYDQNGAGTGTLGANSYLTTIQTANYNSLQISANRQMTHNLMVNGFYVWSHALQSTSEGGGGQSTAQDFDNLWEERGAMSIDRRNVATISGTWDIDYYRGSNFLINHVVNGWTIAPIYSVQSGTPFDVTTGSDKNDDSENANRPDLVAGVSALLSPHRSREAAAAEWFNPAAFVANGPGVAGGIGPGGADGNESRTYLRAPGYKDVDLGIFRDFHIERGIIFQLRGEATNAFNFVNLNAPTASLASSTDGEITGAGSPRIMQVGARLTF
jgi:hypothetical protein